MSKKSNKNLPKEEVVTQEVATKAEVKKESKPIVVKAKKKEKKDKKSSVMVKKRKETGSELKKVSWPTFPKVIKQTGVVFAVVLIFTTILLGIDRLLSWLFDLLTSGIM